MTLDSRMGKLAIAAALLWLIKVLILEPLFPPTETWLKVLYDLILMLLFFPLIYFTWRLFRRIQRRFLWKIRRRLILSHVFVGLIPLLVLISIVLVAALLIYHQFSNFLVLNQLGLHIGQVEAYTQALRGGIDEILKRPGVDPADLQEHLNREARFIQASFPQASLRLHLNNARTGEAAMFQAGFSEKLPVRDYRLPEWLNGNDFSGLVFDPVDVSSMIKEGLFKKRRQQWSNLFLRAVTFSDARPDIRFSVEVTVPVDQFLLRKLKSALGVELYLTKPNEERLLEPGRSINADTLLAATDDSFLADPQRMSASPFQVGLFPILWETGKESLLGQADMLFVELSLSRLYQNLFLSESSLSQEISRILRFLLFFFLGVLVVSMLIATLLTKTITNAVHNLDRGTRLIKRGDFNHRIIVKSRDQLGGLAESFNRMIESVQGLLVERVEKERMERELEIAKEVQMQLFPRQSPTIQGLEISGMCLPARTVSGDYFDYLAFSPEVLAVVIGDICGKGISAALLMANLQATLRTYVARLAMDEPAALQQLMHNNMVAGMFEQINRQIFNFTSPNKFASLFCVVFDRGHGHMTYCNAGHNPPILLKTSRTQQLKTGGTVIGIFAEAGYRQESMPLEPGDLIMAYTDGIIEAVNEYGDEFGEDQLEQLLLKYQEEPVEEIQRRVIDAVVDWSCSTERDDDMTLVLARVKEDWVKS
jgi:phosphoserine phosphatase RsbU/P